MDALRQYLLAIGGLVVIIGILGLLTPFVVYGQTVKGVNVVNQPTVNVGNKPDVSVPDGVTVNGTVDVSGSTVDATVNGTVDVTSLPIVDAAQSGTWDVGITNDETNPVPVVVQNGASDGLALVEITAAPTNNSPVVVFTVPNGQRVVITDVVISGGTGGGIVAIERNGVRIAQGSLSNNRRYQQTYRSGIEFNQGDTVGVVGLNNVGPIFFELRGVQTNFP